MCERRDFRIMADFYRNNDRFNVLYYKNKGFISYWDLDDFIFAEHFAVSSDQRNKGIGSKILSKFLLSVTKPVILEIEPPIDDLTVRRMEFYHRNGFTTHSHTGYRQPPLHNDGFYLPLLLMSYGNIDVEGSYKEIERTIYKNVYQIQAD